MRVDLHIDLRFESGDRETIRNALAVFMRMTANHRWDIKLSGEFAEWLAIQGALNAPPSP